LANGPKERTVLLQPSQQNLWRIKAKTQNVQPWNMEQLSQTKGGKKGGRGSQQPIAGRFKISKIAVK